ncbi:MAG: Rho termination factor N-terminal domain-containing protein, partial [Bacillota bacterium]|nr:Rho termination factor N-terminal domain-containing protein [Bacillota bacterium]
MELAELKEKKVAELKEIATAMGIDAAKLKKQEIIDAIASIAAENNSPEPKVEEETKDDNRYDTTGILDIAEGGFGFLRY